MNKSNEIKVPAHFKRKLIITQEEARELVNRNAELEHALCLIYEWEAPQVDDNGVNRSYSYMYGSNGERDYFRNVAFDALQISPRPPVVNQGE